MCSLRGRWMKIDALFITACYTWCHFESTCAFWLGGFTWIYAAFLQPWTPTSWLWMTPMITTLHGHFEEKPHVTETGENLYSVIIIYTRLTAISAMKLREFETSLPSGYRLQRSITTLDQEDLKQLWTLRSWETGKQREHCKTRDRLTATLTVPSQQDNITEIIIKIKMFLNKRC